MHFGLTAIQKYAMYLPRELALNKFAWRISVANQAYLKSNRGLIAKVQYIWQITQVVIINGAKVLGMHLYSTFFFMTRLVKIKRWESEGCQEDLARLPYKCRAQFSDSIQKELFKEVYVQEPLPVFERLPSPERKAFRSSHNQILSYCSRSFTVYGPIIRLWVESLLAKANADKGNLIFLARDGIAPYAVCLKLFDEFNYAEKYPNLTKDNISLVYLSRKVISWTKQSGSNTEIAKRYLRQQIKYSETQRYLFVDIGFAGSMIDKIMQLVLDCGLIEAQTYSEDPKKITFHYLISHTSKAEGFLGNLDKPLEDVASAGKNPAVYWLEDSHQGNEKSPSELIESDGHIYPDTIIKGKQKLCSTSPLQSLLRQFSLQASIDGACQFDSSTPDQVEKALKLFQKTLKQIKAFELPLFIEHI